jgi:hypothetical protein
MAAPTIAPPVDTVIKIDPKVEYYYVIPQTGATSATVDAVANWSLSINFGQTPVLRLRYDGAIPGTPLAQNINIHLTNDDGTTNQTLAFQVGDYASRKVPNVISNPSTTTAVGSTIAFPLAADIKARFDAAGLPRGLSISGTVGSQTIVGAPLGTLGSYVVVLTATNPQTTGKYYKRYWVLNITAPISGSTLDVAAPGSQISQPIHVLYDGDYTKAQQAGAAIPVNPIPEDPQPYIYRIRYWQFLANYSTSLPAPGSAGPNGGYYVGEVPNSFHDIGGGVVEFVREFAFVPQSRNEFESFVYSYQYWQVSGGNGSITEVPVTTLSRVQYDYFHLSSVPAQLGLQAPEFLGGGAPMLTQSTGGWQGSPGSAMAPFRNRDGSITYKAVVGSGSAGASGSIDIALPHAPRAFQLFNAIYFRNGYGTLVNGEEILAEDATLKQWRGLIFERKQRFVTFIDPTAFQTP